MPEFDTGLVWFRRDLRTSDQTALAEALRRCATVRCVFVFDQEILAAQPPASNRRVAFLRESVVALREGLEALGGGLIVSHGQAPRAIPALAARLGAGAVFCNRDYEPAAVARDDAIASALADAGRRLLSFKDQVVYERDDLMTGAGTPYSVFTPYKRAWLKRFAADGNAADCRTGPAAALAPASEGPVPTLAELGFDAADLDAIGVVPGEAGAAARLADFAGRIRSYDEQRDFPAVRGVSYLSAHLRFGTVSVREAVRLAVAHGALADDRWGAATWLSELIWRDFYFQILHHHPHVVGGAFKRDYDRIRWVSDEDGTMSRLLAAWCAGRTGYPIVDAAMTQLNRTGYMHNRLRMIVASFLTKDLGIDWRLGEAYFAARLIDHDLAANNGGWQWAASTGCDAQPYFRIFNPVAQSRRFDPKGRFIRRHLPVLAGLDDDAVHAPWLADPVTRAAAGVTLDRDYPSPVVDHATARAETLARYEAATGRR